MYENRILRNLRVISNVRLIQVPEAVVATEQFVSEQEGLIRVRSSFVNQQTMAIGMAVTDIFDLVLANPAENTRERLHCRDVLAITEKFWELVYQAVVTCIKGSIGMLKARIKHSFGMSFFSLAGSPFFRVNVELVLKTLKTNPSLSDVQLAINRCALAILRSVRITPWTLKYCPKNSSLFSIMDKVLGAREIVPVLLLLTGTVEKIKVEVDSYVGTLNRFGHLWNQDKEAVVEEFLATQPSMDDFIERLTTFDARWAEIRDSPTIHTIGPLSLSTESVKAALKEEIDKWKLLFTKEIHAQALAMLGEHLEWIRSMARKLDISVRDLDDVRQVSQTLQEIIQSEIEQEEAVLDIDQRFRVCVEFGFSVPEEHIEKLRTMKSEWERVQQKSQASNRLTLNPKP
jgi:dynein heavy chain